MSEYCRRDVSEYVVGAQQARSIFTGELITDDWHTAEMAFVPAPPPGDPTPPRSPHDEEWHPAEIVDGTVRVLTGPGALELPLGEYIVWSRVHGTTETAIVRLPDRLHIVG